MVFTAVRCWNFDKMLAPVVPEHTPTSLVTIGRILKPFGVRGEVKVESMSDVPGRFSELHSVHLALQHGTPLETTVTTVRQVNLGYIMGFSAFSTPEEAALYRGAWIQVQECADLPREPGTFYQFELIGLRVEDPDGQPMGNVEEIMDYPQHQVLVIRNNEKEVLIPVSRQTIEMVDLHHKFLRLTSKEWWDVNYAL